LTFTLIGAGVFSLVLGVVHLRIPAILRYEEAIGADRQRTAIGVVRIWPLRYDLRPRDLVGVAWVMSNAASYVLLTIGLVDILWSTGWRGVPIAIGASWISGWWGIRAAGQLVVGRRSGDVAVAGWFAALALVHLIIAVNPG
jgi:hypothetical protein